MFGFRRVDYIKTPLVVYLDGVEVFRDDNAKVVMSTESGNFSKKFQFLEKCQLERKYKRRIMAILRSKW